MQILPNEFNICDWQSPVPWISVDIFLISAHDGPVSHWDELCPKKVFCWYCAHLFWEAIVEQLSKRVGHHFAKAFFSEIQVWVCRKKIVPKQLISNQIFERPNIFIQFCSLKRNYIFPISRHWDVTVSLALSLICWGRDGTLLSITLKSKWPPLPSSCFVFSFGFWLWTGDLGGKGGKSREAQIKCRLIWSRHRLKPFLASKLLSP